MLLVMSVLRLLNNQEQSTKKYFYYVPHQTVTFASVNFFRNPQLEYNERYILVADIHSHGTIDAFFSLVDNADELGTRLFAVFGGYQGNYMYPDIKIRAGSGGLFKPVPKDMLVDNNDDKAMYMQTIRYLSQMGARIKKMP